MRGSLVWQWVKRMWCLPGAALCLLTSLGSPGCVAENDPSTVTASAAPPAAAVLRLATTTSTRDSGLLDVLLPGFEGQQGCRVDVIAVGTGAALRLGEAGDVDVLVVHARTAEQAFMAAKYGTRHEEFMYNNFLLVGPASDPAKIRALEPAAALARIATGRHVYFSRGDDSGTHKRELQIWDQVGGLVEWADYREVGQGMGPTLMMADEKQGYTLVDMGTYLKFKEKIDLVPLVEEANSLRNPYAALVVSAARHEKLNATLAAAFVDFLISQPTQRQIADYRISGRALFTPTRLDAAP
ncbi:MAG: substrate-binding domain-containing protein [Planctomycetota bacterium]|nr:substrate-binding domain-containing protein [Planctomycetota bacterium]